MKWVSLAVAFGILAAAGSALADMPSVLQHHWKITRPDGSSFTVTYSEDGSYTTDVGIHGAWKLDGDKVCVTRSTGESNCIDAHLNGQTGDSWQSQDAAGKSVTVTLEQ